MTADHHARGRGAATPDGQHHGLAGAPEGRTAYTADELLIEARASLPRRPSPAEALAAQARGALLIDIRGDDQRRACGVIPGALLLPRNALEWRCDPTGQWRHSAMTGRDQHLILICQEGFQSSLAAATLQRLGLVNATDIDGGFAAWATAGLPVIAPPTTGQDHPVTVTHDGSPRRITRLTTSTKMNDLRGPAA
jgi:rhodanese-related sulfurtransferase